MKASKKKAFKSDFDEFVASPKRRRLFEKEYEKLSLSELLLEIMENQSISVRALAERVGVSPTVIQNVRSGKRSNMTLSTLLGISEAVGGEVLVKLGDRFITIRE